MIDCPECRPYGNMQNAQLEIIAHNYSGCGVDHAVCEECGKAWSISYKIDELTRIPSWDGLSREELEQQKLDKIKDLEDDEKQELDRLKRKYE